MTIVNEVRTSVMKLDSKFKHLIKVILLCHIQTNSKLIKNAKDTVKRLFLDAEIFKKLKLNSTISHSKGIVKLPPRNSGSVYQVPTQFKQGSFVRKVMSSHFSDQRFHFSTRSTSGTICLFEHA